MHVRALGSLLFALGSVVVVPVAAAAPQSALERARTLYNEGRFEEAIAAANEARSKPSAAPSATLIAARSRLERFRKTADAQDLALARSELVSLNARTLAPQEAVEWQIGVGIALFLENEAGAAAQAFAMTLPAARGRLTDAEYEKLLEWWGTAMSRVAETLGGDERRDAYEKMRADVRLELDRMPFSRHAAYWLVVATRGAGELDAAWGAAVAAWIRSGNEADGRQLRGDLERFVTQTLIPERAQARTGQRLDTKVTAGEIATLTEEWRAITGRWGSP